MKSSILRLGQFKRYFEALEPHFLRASKESVKAAFDAKESLEVAQAKRSNGWKWSKDKQIMGQCVIPNAWFYHPRMKMGLETMTEEERNDFIAAYSSVYKKLSY